MGTLFFYVIHVYGYQKTPSFLVGLLYEIFFQTSRVKGLNSYLSEPKNSKL